MSWCVVDNVSGDVIDVTETRRDAYAIRTDYQRSGGNYSVRKQP